MVSQGKSANRNAEHLGTTDKGVVLIRRLLAHAIKATLADETPAQPRPRVVDGHVRTYAHESVVRLATPDALDTPGELADFGRRAAMAYVESDALPPAEREREVALRIRGLLERV